MGTIVNQPALVDLARPARKVPDAAATDTARGSAEIATQAEQETGTDTGRIVTPGRQHFHPSAAKGWTFVDPAQANISYNVSSITDSATGITQINWDTDFSAGTYACVVSAKSDASVFASVQNSSFAAGVVLIRVFDTTDPGDLTDPVHFMCVAFGDQ